MDRRSFDLNYENNILFYDKVTTASLRKRQDTYLESSRQVQMSDIEAWPLGQRLWQNTVGMFGPLL
jgi:cardiolipin synthase